MLHAFFSNLQGRFVQILHAVFFFPSHSVAVMFLDQGRYPAGHQPPKICHWGCRWRPSSWRRQRQSKSTIIKLRFLQRKFNWSSNFSWSNDHQMSVKWSSNLNQIWCSSCSSTEIHRETMRSTSKPRETPQKVEVLTLDGTARADAVDHLRPFCPCIQNSAADESDDRICPNLTNQLPFLNPLSFATLRPLFADALPGRMWNLKKIETITAQLKK